MGVLLDPYEQRFDEAVRRQMAEDPSAILKLSEHPDFDRAVPTPDHYIPLLYTAGIAATEGKSQSLMQGYSLGSLSMTSYNIGPEIDLPCEAEGAADMPADRPISR